MSDSANPIECPACHKPFGFWSRRHPHCERRLLMHQLDAHGELSGMQAFYRSQPGWTIATGAPIMRTLNGIGTKLYGQRDVHAATMTATVTLYAVLLFVPLFPIAAYRVVTLPGGYYTFLAKRHPQITDWARAAKVWICILAIIGAYHAFFE